MANVTGTTKQKAQKIKHRNIQRRFLDIQKLSSNPTWRYNVIEKMEECLPRLGYLCMAFATATRCEYDEAKIEKFMCKVLPEVKKRKPKAVDRTFGAVRWFQSGDLSNRMQLLKDAKQEAAQKTNI